MTEQFKLAADRPRRDGVSSGARVALEAPADLDSQAPTIMPSPFSGVFQQLIEGLVEQIALMDDQWNIVTTNEQWASAALEHGHAELLPGGNYKAFCASKAAEGYEPKDAIKDGIEQLEAGTKVSFQCVHEGKGQLEGQVFEICISRIRLADRTVGAVTRTDITELSELRRLREGFTDILVQGQAQERRRITREIHDSTMQLLSCLSLALGRLKRPHRSRQTVEIIAEMESLLGEAQSELRTISYLAHPPLLDEMGLHDALVALIEGFGRRSGLKVVLQWQAGLDVGDHSTEVALYRVVQEALSNVHRHAHADNAIVTLAKRDHAIEARIVDDGVGMPARPVHGVGLTGMRARLADLGGQLTVGQAAPGTELIATVPLETVGTETGPAGVRHGKRPETASVLGSVPIHAM